jgi:hypothetical protein
LRARSASLRGAAAPVSALGAVILEDEADAIGAEAAEASRAIASAPGGAEAAPAAAAKSPSSDMTLDDAPAAAILAA